MPWFVVPLIVLGGLTFFVGLWSFILLMLAKVSGYRSLLAFRSAAAAAGTRLPASRTVYIGPARYRGYAVQLTASREGLGIRMVSLGLFHPPLRVPWDRVEVGASEPRGVLVLLDGRVPMYVPQATGDAIAQAKPG